MDIAARERLTVLVTECNEVVQAGTKALRHGYHSHHPDSKLSNEDDLVEAMLDVLSFWEAILAHGDISRARAMQLASRSALLERFEEKKKYMHHQ